MKRNLDLNDLGFLLLVFTGLIVCTPILLGGVFIYALVKLIVGLGGWILDILIPVYSRVLEKIRK